MNARTLQKQYDKLTARERFALLVAARDRGDDAEVRQLQASAPRFTFTVAHHVGMSLALLMVARWYVLRLLDDAGTMMLLAHVDGEHLTDLVYDGELTAAYNFCILSDAWQMFCGELGIDPAAPLKGLPGADHLLSINELVAREFAPTFAEMQEIQQRNAHLGFTEVRTVEAEIAALRQQFHEWADTWQ